MSLYRDLGVATIINAKGPATRLSGGLMAPAVAAAMVEASQSCVDMAELQAAASREIARATGAEAGYVASGASASLLLAAAAAMAGLDPGRMARLPDTRGMNNEIIMVRSQRNFYDHAIRAAGAQIVEVGLPDRYAGAGVRDAEPWEIEDAITANTAAIFHVADDHAQPALPAVVRVAKKHKIPVIVDAAAQLPPQSNLRRFIGEGADLVAFSGGKALGGPQASGFLAGRRDLIMSAALQHLDLDIHDDMWSPPRSLIDRRKLKGTPQHGIGRSCKAGKEEIAGLLTALRLFIAEGDSTRHRRWLNVLAPIPEAKLPNCTVVIEGEKDTGTVPLLVLTPGSRAPAAKALIAALVKTTPPIHADPSRRHLNQLVINPMSMTADDAATVAQKLAGLLKA